MKAYFAAISATAAIALFTGCTTNPQKGTSKVWTGSAAAFKMPTDPDLLTVAIHTVPEGAAIFAAGKYIGNSPVDGLYVPNEYSKAKGLVTFEITAAWPSGAIWDGIVVTPMPPGHPLKNASVSLIQPSKVDGPYQDSLHVRMMGPLFALEDQRLRAEQRQRSEQEMAQMRARQEANQRAQQEAQQRAQQEAQQQQQQQQQAGSGVSGTDIALMLLGGFLTGVVQGMNRPVAPMINCRSDTYGNTTRTSCY